MGQPRARNMNATLPLSGQFNPYVEKKALGEFDCALIINHGAEPTFAMLARYS